MTIIQTNLAEFGAVAPEILLMLWALAILALDLLTRRGMTRRALGIATAGGMLLILLASLLFMPGPEQNQSVLGGMIRYDLFSYVMRAVFLLGGALTALVAVDFKAARAGGEFYALLILATMSMGLMAAANDMIMVYLATEAASIALYLLAGFMRDTKRSAEAGIKYFVFGAVTSTIMLYGMSLLYGVSGATGYGAVAQAVREPEWRYVATFALVLIAIGFLFKTSAVPFHFWAPDVYEGAPTPVSGFVSTASKAAGFAIMLRFLFNVFPPEFGSQAASVWVYLMQPVAILTMFVGNLGAAVQTSVKRMLAYSSVAQAGYMFVGAAAFGNLAYAASSPAATGQALASVIFYLATYLLANVGAFAIVGVISQRVGGETFKDFAGLGRRAPYLALFMTAAMVSLIGAPPMVGFAAKLYVFRSAIELPNLLGLVVLGVINVLISVYYYLGVVKAMYVDKSDRDSVPMHVPAPTMWVAGICAAGMIFTLVMATPFYNLASVAARSFMLRQ